jgi:pilus assembly protein CpaF
MAVRIPGIDLNEYYAQLGPIEPLIRDDRVTEVMCNGPDHVYVEMNGKVVLTNIKFGDEDQLVNVIQFIVRSVGRRIDERSPLCDARLADGSRVNAVIRPLAIDGPLLTVRKFARDPFQVEDLIRFGSCTEPGFGFLKAAVLAKANVIVSGGTGTGKTTFLNVLSSFIPAEDRIVTIEDAAELQLHQEHVCRLESRPKDINGEGEVTIQRLVINSLRMRPERIVVGECRGGEALDMLQAMNTGHDGSMTTIHANSPRDALARLETLVLMAGVDLPVKAIRQQVASAINIFCQLSRLRDGSRKVTSITEIAGMEGETITMQEIFVFESHGAGPDGKIVGEFKPTGIRPQILDRMFAMGLPLPPEILSLFPDPRSNQAHQHARAR